MEEDVVILSHDHSTMPIAGIQRELESFSRWFAWALCIIFALYVSLWLFTIRVHALQQAQHIVPTLPVVAEDSAEYTALAESLLRGNGFAQNGQLETLRTPGYPVFVAVIQKISGSYFAVTFIQIFIAILSALIIRRIGMRFASRAVGEAAAVLFLLNPVTLTLSLLIYSDMLFLLLFASGFYAALSLEEKRFVPRILCIALLFGLAIYVRPIGLLAIPMFAAPIVASRLAPRVKRRAVVALLVCLLLLISPWMARNYARTGVFGFTSIQASSLSWATARFLANEDGISVAEAKKELEAKIGAPESAWRDIRLSRRINTVDERVILERPFSYAAYHLTTSLPFLFPSTIAFAVDTYNGALNRATPSALGAIRFLAAGDVRAFYQGITQSWWKVIERIGWLSVTAIALYAAWRRRKDALAYVLLFVIGYLMLLAGPAAGPRYSLQAWPFLLILFATGCQRLYERFVRPKTPHAIPAEAV